MEMVLDEMWTIAQEEMNFLKEASNIEEFSRNNRDVRYVGVPRKYQEYSIDRRNITVVMLSSVFMAVVVVIVETLMNNLILKLFASVLSGVFVFTVLNIFSQNHKMVKSYISELSKRKNIENS